MQMLGQMLGRIDAAVTAARTSESKHQVGKTAPEVTRHMGIRQFVDAVQERQNLSVLFQKTDNGFVQARQGFVRFIPSGIVHTAAIEHITASIPAGIFGNPLLIGETEHAHDQRPSAIVQETEAGPMSARSTSAARSIPYPFRTVRPAVRKLLSGKRAIPPSGSTRHINKDKDTRPPRATRANSVWPGRCCLRNASSARSTP